MITQFFNFEHKVMHILQKKYQSDRYFFFVGNYCFCIYQCLYSTWLHSFLFDDTTSIVEIEDLPRYPWSIAVRFRHTGRWDFFLSIFICFKGRFKEHVRPPIERVVLRINFRHLKCRRIDGITTYALTGIYDKIVKKDPILVYAKAG